LDVVGIFVIIVVLLLIPVLFLASTPLAAAAIGWALKNRAELDHAGSELVDCTN
jgi:hypothetical protein